MKLIFCLCAMLFLSSCATAPIAKNAKNDYSVIQGIVAGDVQIPFNSEGQIVFALKDLTNVPIEIPSNRLLTECFLYGRASARHTGESDTGTKSAGSIGIGRIYFLASHITCFTEGGVQVANQKIKGFVVDEDEKLGFRAVSILPVMLLGNAGHNVMLWVKQ